MDEKGQGGQLTQTVVKQRSWWQEVGEEQHMRQWKMEALLWGQAAQQTEKRGTDFWGFAISAEIKYQF